jgi:AraC-like DNA-binding protein
MYFSLQSVLMLIIVCQGLLFSVFLLLLTSSKKLPSRILFLFTLFISLLSLSNLLVNLNFVPDYQYGVFFGLSFGPLLLFFGRSLIYNDYRLSASDFNHFVLPLLGFTGFIVLPFLNIYSVDVRKFNSLITVTVSVQFFLYVFWLYQEIAIYNSAIKNSFSTITKINLSWLRYLIISTTILFAIVVAESLLSDDFDYVMTIFIYFYILIFINGLYYKGVRQPEVFSGISSMDVHSFNKPKYHYSDLSEESADQYLMHLLEYMDKAKPFLKAELTLDMIATETGIPTRAISQIINEKLRKNFFDFVNGYRVERAKELLVSNENLRVSEIMYDCGFDSKSTFNQVFKKFASQTPSEYRKTSKSKVTV